MSIYIKNLLLSKSESFILIMLTISFHHINTLYDKDKTTHQDKVCDKKLWVSRPNTKNKQPKNRMVYLQIWPLQKEEVNKMLIHVRPGCKLSSE